MEAEGLVAADSVEAGSGAVVAAAADSAVVGLVAAD